jgi:hypothetical protein
MRLWSLHPRYLDAVGLVALWREALLARAVLRGETKGYRHHPQLLPFRACRSPRSAINVYLGTVYSEATLRGYAFDRTKLARGGTGEQLVTTRGQLDYEWSRLLGKLRLRSPALYRRHRRVAAPAAHPLFSIIEGPICEWEKVK